MKISSFVVETILASRGVSRKSLADSADISRQNVSTILRRGTCRPETAGKIARALGVPVEQIAAGGDR